jgi:peptide/nickel transport system substrate-binding protein
MQTQITELKSGVIDVMGGMPATDFTALEKDSKFTKDFSLDMAQSCRMSALSLNIRNPKLSDSKVRKAIANAINYDEIMKTIFPGGSAIRLNTVVHPTKEYNRKDLTLVPFNTEMAKQLLTEAGWKDSNGNGTVDKMLGGKLTELNLSLLIPNKSPMPEFAVLIQNSLKQVGIGIEIIAKDFNLIKEDVKKHNFEIVHQASNGNTDLDNFEQKWHSTQGSNDTGFGSPILDKLIAQINSTLDRKARNELYGKFQEIIYQEQPAIMLFSSKERVAYSKRLDNVALYPNAPFYFERYFKVK